MAVGSGMITASITIVLMMMEAISTSETSVNFYEATRRNIPDVSRLKLEICSRHMHE
jgi:hypothetical protein